MLVTKTKWAILAACAASACSGNFDALGAGGRASTTTDFSTTETSVGTGGRSTSGQGGSGGSAKAGSAGAGGGRTDAGSTDGAPARSNDGAIDAQGRPTGITIAPSPMSTAQRSPSPGGNPFLDMCAPNEVIVGFTGTVDEVDGSVSYLRSFRAECSAPSIAAESNMTYRVSLVPAESLTVRGLAGAVTQTRRCGANEMVVGFAGRSGAYIDQISILCAPLLISGSAPNFTVSVGPTGGSSNGIGGTGGEPFDAIACPPGQIAVGDQGRAGAAIDAFGLLCATPTLVIQ
jgi:hypothetical protein